MKKKRKAAVFVTSQDWDENIVTTGDWLEEFELFEMELEFYNKMFQKVFVLIVRKSQKEDFETLKEKISHLIQKVQLFNQKPAKWLYENLPGCVPAKYLFHDKFRLRCPMLL